MQAAAFVLELSELLLDPEAFEAGELTQADLEDVFVQIMNREGRLPTLAEPSAQEAA